MLGLQFTKSPRGLQMTLWYKMTPMCFKHISNWGYSMTSLNAQMLDVPFPDWVNIIVCFNVFSSLRWFTNVNPRHNLPSGPAANSYPQLHSGEHVLDKRHERWDPSFAGNSHQATLRSILRMPLAIAAPWVLLARQGCKGGIPKMANSNQQLQGDRCQAVEGKLLGPVQSYL